MIAAPHDASREIALRRSILQAIARATEVLPWIDSATVAGSFATSETLDGVSDIDLIVIAERLDAERLGILKSTYETRLAAALRAFGWDLHVNMTLGPLKFNAERLAVLHLMPYTAEGHVQHVIQSPFTCLDWQSAPIAQGRALADIYPVFGLQPKHFVSARRGLADYLKDLHAGVVSWREIVGAGDSIAEIARQKPMGPRDRQEFGWHILKFTMRNILKLILRVPLLPGSDDLPEIYFEHFPDGRDIVLPLYRELARRKRAADFDAPLPQMEAILAGFLQAAEAQLRAIFETEAVSHCVLRHARPEGTVAGEIHFLGRSDPGLAPASAPALALPDLAGRRVVASPLRRCKQTAELLGRAAETDERLLEIDYGFAEGMTVAELRSAFPQVVAGWEAGVDARFPGGENSADVLRRVMSYLTDPRNGEADLIVTHNVVIRCLLGTALNVPFRQWHRMRVPYCTPFSFRWHNRYGLFVDLEADLHRQVFADFEMVRTSESGV